MSCIVYSPSYSSHRPELWLERGDAAQGGTPTAGHPDVPERVDRILEANDELRWSIFREHGDYDISNYLYRIHSSELVDYYRELDIGFANGTIPEPVLGDAPATGGPRIERFCTDDVTPLGGGTWDSACGAFSSAIRAAEMLTDGSHRVSYAVSRPGGHRAGRSFYGGYCYLNNVAIAASVLGFRGKVAVLDLDYHHGNGTQEIFYAEKRVLTTSIHAASSIQRARAAAPRPAAHDPSPSHTGAETERGIGKGQRRNLNLIVPDRTGRDHYLELAGKALRRIKRFRPRALVVALGVDTIEGDPIGALGLPPDTLDALGTAVGSLKLPTVVVQEGGYNLETLGGLVTRFLRSLSAQVEP